MEKYSGHSNRRLPITSYVFYEFSFGSYSELGQKEFLFAADSVRLVLATVEL